VEDVRGVYLRAEVELVLERDGEEYRLIAEEVELLEILGD